MYTRERGNPGCSFIDQKSSKKILHNVQYTFGIQAIRILCYKKKSLSTKAR